MNQTPRISQSQRGLLDLFVDSSKQELNEIKKQNDALIKINDDLRSELLEIKTQLNNNRENQQSQQQQLNHVSLIGVRQFVAEMLAKEECNIDYIPDFIEKRLYEKIFEMILKLLDHTLSTTSLNVMGHQITLQLASQNSTNVTVTPVISTTAPVATVTQKNTNDLNHTVLK
jgi:hypothetical protein